MSTPQINLSKVQSLAVIAADDGFVVQAVYKSGLKRGFTYGNDEPGLDALFAEAISTGVTVTPLNGQPQPPQPPDGAVWCQWCGERPAAPGQPCDVCQKLGAEPEHLSEQTGQADAPVSNPNTLVQMLGLNPEQAKHLEGVNRLNFWRNGSLHLQANHGSRGIKLSCPKATVTDAQLVEFFASWGWQQLGAKPYFKSTPASLVRL